MSEESEVWIEVGEGLVIPIGKEHDFILFTLPALYIAKADGVITFDEAMNIAASIEVFGGNPQNKEKLASYESVLAQFYDKHSLDDLDKITKTINERLEEYDPEEAMDIRNLIRELCVNVAKASGPEEGSKISAEEHKYLREIYKDI